MRLRRMRTSDDVPGDTFAPPPRPAVTRAMFTRVAGHGIDLVILNGCVNDLDPFFGIPLGTTPGVEDLPKAVLRECTGVGAAAENPAKNVPYFSGAKVGYGGRGMQAAIEKAHSLPGNPKVLVADFNYAFSRA